MDRLHVEITGPLPDAGKYAIIAAAEAAMEEWVKGFSAQHKIELTVSVRSVRPGKGKSASSKPTLVTDQAAD